MSQLAMQTELKLGSSSGLGERTGGVSVTDLVGNTPLLRLSHITGHLTPAVEVYAKAEWYNPSGSVKDRPALNIIRAAPANVLLTTGKALLDSTSGNMGLAYATLAAPLGLRVQLVMPENVSP